MDVDGSIPSGRTMKQAFTVDKEYDGVRMDLFLSKIMSTSRGQAQTLIQSKRVKIDDKPVSKSSIKVSTNQTVSIAPEEMSLHSSNGEKIDLPNPNILSPILI